MLHVKALSAIVCRDRGTSKSQVKPASRKANWQFYKRCLQC